MANFDKGVSFYTQGKAEITVNFPENDICCKWCPHCRSEDSLKRHWCRLTGRMIYSPMTTIGEDCPLSFKEE